MSNFEDNIIRLFGTLHPLDRVPRAGFVICGVAEPESVAAHSHFISVMALLYVDKYPDMFKRDKALAMALTHDLPEAHLMDIPMAHGGEAFEAEKEKAEIEISESLFEGLGAQYTELQREVQAAETPEARLIRGLDKAQMMIKIINYEKEGRGALERFWGNPANFNDFGIEPVSRLFDAICKEAGRERPRN